MNVTGSATNPNYDVPAYVEFNCETCGCSVEVPWNDSDKRQVCHECEAVMSERRYGDEQ